MTDNDNKTNETVTETVENESAEVAQTETEPVLTLSQAEALFNKRIKELEKKFEARSASKPKEEEDKALGPVKAMQKELEALRAEREAERAAKLETQLRSTVKDVLMKNNVPNHLVKAAMAVLVDSDKLVRFNDEGELVYADPRFGEYDVEKGLKQWLQSEDGKAFQSPKGAQGSGDRAYRPGAPKKPQTNILDLLDDAYKSGDF